MKSGVESEAGREERRGTRRAETRDERRRASVAEQKREREPSAQVRERTNEEDTRGTHPLLLVGNARVNNPIQLFLKYFVYHLCKLSQSVII